MSVWYVMYYTSLQPHGSTVSLLLLAEPVATVCFGSCAGFHEFFYIRLQIDLFSDHFFSNAYPHIACFNY